ncbi:hypothetical protein PF007_g32680, partial [Phytophthora fragariae]
MASFLAGWPLHLSPPVAACRLLQSSVPLASLVSLCLVLGSTVFAPHRPSASSPRLPCPSSSRPILAARRPSHRAERLDALLETPSASYEALHSLTASPTRRCSSPCSSPLLGLSLPASSTPPALLPGFQSSPPRGRPRRSKIAVQSVGSRPQ